MNAKLGWVLAALAMAVGYWRYDWPGMVLALSVIVFWLLLQFSRALRAMRQAGSAPVGHVASAVMLQSRLKKGQRLMDVIQLTRSLGRKTEPVPSEALDSAQETFSWTDDGGASVELRLIDGRVADWRFQRAPEPEPGPPSP